MNVSWILGMSFANFKIDLEFDAEIGFCWTLIGYDDFRGDIVPLLVLFRFGQLAQS